MAGGQSLGPMLNLRLAQPSLLVRCHSTCPSSRVSRPARTQSRSAPASLMPRSRTGACPTSARRSWRIADGIAYRAVRNRGTIGGSLAHADPAADWVTALTALGASVVTYRASDGGRTIPLDGFFLAGFRDRAEARRDPASGARAAPLGELRAGASTRSAASRASSPPPWRPSSAIPAAACAAR